MSTPSSFRLSFLLSCLVLLVGCGKPTASSTGTPTAAAPASGGMEAELAKTIKEQSNFYVFKTPADLPAGLKWENGADLPEFANPNAKKGGTFNYFISDFPRTIRTIGPDATGGIRPYLLDYVEPGFINPHPNLAGGAYPGLLTEWAVGPDGRTIYYRIDPKARWSDGKPLTTDDVVFTLYFMRSPHLNEPWYNDFYEKNYRQLIVFDKLTFATVHPDKKPDLAVRFGGFVPYPRHAHADFGAGWLERFQWRELPKLGAYVLRDKDIEKGRSVTLTRVKDWWAADKRFFRGRFNPDRYHLEVIRDPDKAAEAFARGDIDTFGLGLPKYWYETIPDTHPEVAAGRLIKFKFFNQTPRPDWGLWINSAKPGLNNRDVRTGIHHASNIELVCTQFFRGDAVQMQTRSDGYGWRMHPTITARPFDPVKARAFFAKAGYTTQGPDGVLTNASGQRLSFTITAAGQALRDMLPILKQEALKAGLEFNLEILDSTTGWKKIQEKNHDIALAALSRSVELYPRYWEMYHGSNAYTDAYSKDGKTIAVATGTVANTQPKQVAVQTNNMTMTFIPELDRLIEAYDKAETLEDIKSLAAQIEQIIHDDASWVNGWQRPFYRGGYWRYVKWPEGFNVAQSRDYEEFFVHWIDTDEKKEVEAARRAGRTYPTTGVQVFDQFKTK
jgi:microcin C transport system substrate-binding protein